jgi:hypothetical protein
LTGLDVDQEQPAGPVIVIDPLAPDEGGDNDAGLTVNEQVAAGWFTVNGFPAIVSVADLAVVFGLAAAVKAADPLPVPLPVVIVTQLAPLDALHEHPDGAVTPTDPDPPAAETDWLVDEMLNVQDVPASVTVNVLPPMVREPFRDDVPLLADTL